VDGHRNGAVGEVSAEMVVRFTANQVDSSLARVSATAVHPSASAHHDPRSAPLGSGRIDGV